MNPMMKSLQINLARFRDVRRDETCEQIDPRRHREIERDRPDFAGLNRDLAL